MQQAELYDRPDKINVETFYKISKTGNLELLKVNPEDQVDEDVLNDVWLDLQEYYFSHTNHNTYDLFKRNMKNVVALQSELVACHAALKLVELCDERGLEILPKLGIKDKDITKIRSAINRKQTNLNFAKSKLERVQKNDADVSFYRILASVSRRIGFPINPTEYHLERWVETLADLHEKEEAERQMYNDKKRK